MSRRIETRTEITDRELAEEALKSAGIQYAVTGNTIRLQSGNYRNASIDLRTGTISGDDDYGHSKKLFGMLRQHYSEAKIRDAFLKEGITVEERQVNANGDVVLTWSSI